MQDIMVQTKGKKSKRDKKNRKEQLLYHILEKKEITAEELAIKLDVTIRSVYIYLDELTKEELIFHLKSGKIIINSSKITTWCKEQLKKLEPASKTINTRLILIKKFLEEN